MRERAKQSGPGIIGIAETCRRNHSMRYIICSIIMTRAQKNTARAIFFDIQ